MLGGALRSLETALLSSGETLRSFEETLRSFEETLRSFEETLRSLGEALRSFEETLRSLEKTLHCSGETLRSLEIAMPSSGEALRSLEKTLHSSGETLRSLETALFSSGQTLHTSSKALLSLGGTKVLLYNELRRSGFNLLKQKLEKHITHLLSIDETKIELYKEEKDYSIQHQLIPPNVEVTEKAAPTRFADAYVERCEKETVALLLVETPMFLDGKTDHLKKHKNEFVYVESKSFEMLGIDAISLELDDVFGTYTALFGLQLQKKYGSAIKEYLDTHLTGEEGKYSVAFSGKDGLWDMNFAINYADGFNEDMTLLEAYTLVYSFIFSMVEEIEDAT